MYCTSVCATEPLVYSVILYPSLLVILNDKLFQTLQVLTTHYVLDNLNPQWERGVEFFVSDLSQTSLMFLVYDWDGPLIGDDLLGATKLSLTQV